MAAPRERRAWRRSADVGKVLGGAEGNRTPDLLIANEALYHLSYGPKEARRYVGAAGSSSARLPLSTAFACQGGRGAARSDALDGKLMVDILKFVFFILGAC
jgi:hypothetical protein